MSFSMQTSLSLNDTEEVSLNAAEPTMKCFVSNSQHDSGGGPQTWSPRPQPPTSLPGIAPASSAFMNSHPIDTPQCSTPTVQDRLDSLKAWSISTYKYSRQLISEKLGKSSRTVDAVLDGQIERLRETQKKYLNILKLARALSSHFYNMTNTQLQLSEQFSELSQRNPELHQQFSGNADTQRVLYKHGATLLSALNFFVSSVNTLCNKTMDDTLATVKQYESARVEYDAYRADLLWMQQCGEFSETAGATSSRAAEAKRHYDQRHVLYEKLRSDVIIKLRFLDENRVKVMTKQLTLLNTAVSGYFSGNSRALQQALLQYGVLSDDQIAGGLFLGCDRTPEMITAPVASSAVSSQFNAPHR